MSFRILVSFCVATCLMLSILMAETPQAGKAPSGESESRKAASTEKVFQQFAQLEGEWVGKGTHGDLQHDAKVVYKLTSGGTVVVETIDPGGEHEMITVIHPDGDALALTHYCMIGNQPHMQAKPKAGEKQVAFEFIKAGNLKSDKEMHMHNVTYTFVDKDTFKAEWTNYEDGKKSGTSVFELKRKK